MEKKLTVFLGGTCATSTWREELIPMLDEETVSYFNPVVEDWTPECQAVEDEHKANDDVVLFVLTPESKSIYSWVEVALAAARDPERTVICVLPERNGQAYEGHELKAVTKAVKDIKGLGVPVFGNLNELSGYLNERANKQTNNNKR
jgi:hypothetical protein